MNKIFITLAVEDSLSEAVAKKILLQSQKEYHVVQCLGKNGFGYLKSKINAFNQAAKGMPFFVLTDQDSTKDCPPSKISKWLNQPRDPNLIFRVAIMEIESWVMAHRTAISGFLSVPLNHLPQETDSIQDPKQALLSLVKKSRSHRLKTDLLPQPGSTAKVGPYYNNRLIQFVRNEWNAYQASENSESLKKALVCLHKFTPIYKEGA
ncbi:MAG: hypothetical protein ACE5F7_02775 [Nitrospiria bacterium]